MPSTDEVEMESPTVPPASPINPLSEIEDYSSNSDDDDDDNGFAPSGGRKRRHDGNAQQQHGADSLQYSMSSPTTGGGGGTPGDNNDRLKGRLGGNSRPMADSLQYSEAGFGGSYDPNQTSQQLGSWYFQPAQGSQLGSAYGSDFHTSYTQNGMAVPPHLSYWMHQPVSDVSNMSLGQSQMGQIAGSAMSTLHEQGGGGRHPSMPDFSHLMPPDDEYKVYNSRWIMLGYMSLLNLLSDWTCYSVAPIALLTKQAFGDIDPEWLVTIFLGANAMASAMEPAILGRLGLRKTVLFGGFLLMMGSIVKSGGLKGLLMSADNTLSEEELRDQEEEDITWRLYLGFFLVGLSQPLYQCTPALLSASWFPENERTMATGVALNSNQLGIGCAFVFGTMLVSTEEDIIPYFGLLSVLATIAFIGTALQFDDAPPTPPSDSARVIKGDLEFKIPKLPFIGRFGGNAKDEEEEGKKSAAAAAEAPAPASTDEAVEVTLAGIHDVEKEMQFSAVVGAPSPAPTNEPVEDPVSPSHKKHKSGEGLPGLLPPPASSAQPPVPRAQPNHPLAGGAGPPPPPPGAYPPYMVAPPPPGYYPSYPPVNPGMGYSTAAPGFYHGYDNQGHYHNALLQEYAMDDYGPVFAGDDEGVEPIMTQLDHQLDIDIRDDQLIQQVKACFRRKGFAHCVVAFTTSGIIINTLSTFMDYLVTLNGAGREYVGIVGGTFQVLIMCSSLVFGGWTDHSRKYYFVILAMLILGAFALSLCNVELDADAGGDLRLTLLVVAVLAGPLQPISTELGVEVVYPLSENTVLVIQQLFSNLLSAAFIPIFKALRDVGTARDASEIKSMVEVPQYTFSFYMLIIIHAVSTCYFATFNGTYLRYEAESAKKAKKEEEKEKLLSDLHQQHGYGTVEPN